ncbi:unnamed protein product, partial [Heterotrigona itama]
MLPECGFVLGVCERTFGYARVSLRLLLLFRSWHSHASLLAFADEIRRDACSSPEIFAMIL